MKTIEPQDAKFVAVVSGVKEVRLIGTANLDFWNEQLAGKPFQAFDARGFAEITIAATELVWKGFGFNELTVSLSVAANDNGQIQIGYLLLQAFNSNRFFAFCERTFFSTPYRFGAVSLREKMPCAINARSNDRFVLKAEMSPAARSSAKENESWEGAVFLPGGRAEKYFVAKLSGISEIYPFVETDQIELRSETKQDVFGLLRDSGFAGKQWRMGSDAFHAKSKTYSIQNCRR
jgi:hypothetical protein